MSIFRSAMWSLSLLLEVEPSDVCPLAETWGKTCVKATPAAEKTQLYARQPAVLDRARNKHA
jgi:hypothetical protein